MKSAVKMFTLLFVLVFATSAFAGVSGKRTVTLHEPVAVGGEELAPGSYKLSWEGEGDSLKVTLSRDGKSVTTTGKLVAVDKAPRINATSLRANGGGAKHLAEFEFAGKKEKLVIAETKTVASGN